MRACCSELATGNQSVESVAAAVWMLTGRVDNHTWPPAECKFQGKLYGRDLWSRQAGLLATGDCVHLNQPRWIHQLCNVNGG